MTIDERDKCPFCEIWPGQYHRIDCPKRAQQIEKIESIEHEMPLQPETIDD